MRETVVERRREQDGGEGGGGVCADKSLAQTGRKEATATKLRIYSTYFARSSVHFLACCSNFCKPLKKKFRRFSIQPVLRSSSDLHVGRKMVTFQLFLSVQGTGGTPMGPDPENRVGDQDIGSPGRPVSSGFQVPSGTGHCNPRTRPLGDLPRTFSFKMSFSCTSRDE